MTHRVDVKKKYKMGETNKETKEETVREHDNEPKQGEGWWRETEWKQVKKKKKNHMKSKKKLGKQH